MSDNLDPMVRQTIAREHLKEDLADVIAKAGRGVTAKIGKKDTLQAEAVLKAGYFRQFWVRHERQLDSLPVGSIVVDPDNDVFESYWYKDSLRWRRVGSPHLYRTSDIQLSALVVYVPIPYAPD